MFSFKRKKKERRHAGLFWKMMGDLCSPVTQWLEKKLHYRSRIRLLNRWGRHHPKKLFYCYCVCAVIIISLNILSIDFHHPQDIVAPFPDLSDADKVFEKNREIENTHSLIHSVETEYASSNYYLVDRLDSLVKVPVKSHADSVEIVRIYNKLNYLKNIHP